MNTWIRPGLILILALLSAQAFTQRHLGKCNEASSNLAGHVWESGSSNLFEEQVAASPAASARYHANEQLLLLKNRQGSLPGSRAGGFSIPVVVHIVHDQNGISNISNAQVYSALTHLNQGFANQAPFLNLDGVDTEIQFCLAQRDPQGDSTLGITRSASTLTFLTRESQDSSLKALKYWPSTEYLNIWVVASITSSAFGPSITGYTTMPFMHGSDKDGIVIEANYFGTLVDRSKVLVHEAGHYLGLHNTYYGGCDNSNCQSSGDKVCDTPPDASTANANGYVNSCLTDEDDPSPLNPFRSTSLGGAGDQPDQIENYMDRGDLRVQSKFTPGQKDRMQSQLQLFRSSLLSSRGCLPPCPSAVTAAFSVASQMTFGDSAQLMNASVGATDYTWLVNGQIFSHDPNPFWTPSTTGIFEVVLEAGNGQTGCTEVASQQVAVECDFQADIQAPQISTLPGNQLSFTSVGGAGNGLTWLLDGVPVGNMPTLDYTFTNAGGYTLQLVAQGSGCVDSSDVKFIEIGVCGIEAHTLNWTLGDSIGLNFKGEVPLNWSNSSMFANEGCTTMSDDNGNLMFYSNGVSVWNKDHQPMPNGSNLFGNLSASQGVVAVPYPGSKTKYILFTNDAIEWTFFNGLRYNIIDMALDNGRGDIVAGQKNIWLAGMSSEMITAVQNDNGKDYWLITHEAFGDRFLVYEINSNGINTTPITIQAGPVISLATGAMKVSPNRKRLAITCNAGGARELLVMNFNPANGQLTNPISIGHSPNIQIYGAEFSPDNSKVYFTTLAELFQIDLSLGSQQAVINSKTSIASATSNRILGMQRSVDGNIYIASGFFGKLHKIDYPNVQGAGCGFLWEGQDLMSRQSRWGLPNFAVGIPRNLQKVSIVGPDSVCQGEIVQYQVTKIDTGDVIGWEILGNGILIQSMADSTGTVQFNQSGAVAMIASRTTACGVSRDTFSIVAKASPVVNFGPDTLLCNGENLMLNGAASGASHVWSNGSSSNAVLVQTTGLYWVQATALNGCTATDSILVDELIPNVATPQLGVDTSICEGYVMVLDPGVNQSLDFQWQDGSELSTLTASQQGLYTVAVTNECGDMGFDSLFLTMVPSPSFTLGTDQDICPGDSVDLFPGADYPYVHWQDSSNGDVFQATQPGTYWCEVTNHNGCSARDSIELTPCLFPAGMREVALLEITAYPNPSSGQVNLAILKGGMMDQVNISVMNQLGQQVYESEGYRTLSGPYHLHQIDLDQVEDGIYFIIVKTKSDMEYTARIMIRN